MDCLKLSVCCFTSLQMSNGRAVDSEAPRDGLSDLQGRAELVLTCFQTRRADLKLKSYQKCVFVASFTSCCAVSVAFVSFPDTLCQCHTLLQISVQLKLF